MVKEKEIEIIALEFPDNVRTRSGMYIGATDSPDVILREAIDNSVDELMGSLSCNRLDVQLKSGQRGGWYVIADNGRGIPIIYDEDKQMTKTQLAVGTLNAGSKFKKGSEDISTGLNGVGVSCFPRETFIIVKEKSTGTVSNKFIGDLVDTYKDYQVLVSTGEFVDISNAFETKKVSELCELEFSDGSSVQCTADHRFRLKSGEFKHAVHLSEDDELCTILPDGSSVDLKLTGKSLVTSVYDVPVYDLTVEDGHEFTLFNGLVAHNCTNALSDRFVILSKVTSENFDKSIPFVEAAWNEKRDGELFYVIEFAKGLKVYESTIYRDEVSETYGFEFPEGMSTITAFIPDPTIWKSIVASYNKKSLSYVQVILDRFYHKSCTITIDGVEVNSSFEPYQFEFVKEISITDGERTRAAKFFINFDVDKDMSVNDLTGSINSLIVNRGIHIDWARRSYQEALKRHYNLQHDYTWCGLKMNVICLTANTDFSSQTKERSVKIDNLYIDEVMPELMCEFHNLFHKNEDYFETHVKRLNEYAASLNQISAINKVKQVVGTVDGGNRVRSKLPSSVKDAASNDRGKCEIFICEGKSASGTMLKSRDPNIHAILELRGVPLNSINLDLDTIMDNEEMSGIVTAIGAGVNEYFRIENCRYGKIILAADSDIDGERINSMILGFIARKMTFLIDDGRVFIALAPLYQQGDKYVYPGENPKDIIDMSKPFKRYKGLGEINVKEAKEFFFDTDKRKLLKITSSNLPYVFDLLTQSATRKQLMIRKDVIVDKYKVGIL